MRGGAPDGVPFGLRNEDTAVGLPGCCGSGTWYVISGVTRSAGRTFSLPVCTPILPVLLLFLVDGRMAEGIGGMGGGGISVMECLGRTDPSFGGEGA